MSIKGGPQVTWVWGRVTQDDGAYDDAIAAYLHVLKYFPEDRVAWRQLGRSFYLIQKYEKSIEAYQKVLDIDPEDREAYYHLSLNYRNLRNTQEAEKMEKAFNYYSIDESALEVAQQYRLRNEGANLMTQDIRIHQLKFQNTMNDSTNQPKNRN